MEHWSTTRHSYAKPRLLGDLKAECVYLKLCADHTFLSPAYNTFKQGKVIVEKSPSKMRELRESLRQAALINIVAAVNDGDKSQSQTLSTDNIDSKANQYGLQYFIHERMNVKLRSNHPTNTSTTLSKDRPTAIHPLRSSRVPDPPHFEKQRLCPKLKLSDALVEHFTTEELSILEGHRIGSLQIGRKSTKKKRKVKPDRFSEIDLGEPTMPDVISALGIVNKHPYICSSHVSNQGSITDNGCDILANRITNMLDISDLYRESNTIEPRQDNGHKSGSSQESECSTLHISTTEKGDIGRSAGYFPPPSSKRDLTSKKQLIETRLSKCDAIDILDPTSSTGDVDYPIIFKSQRDNLGEMGACMFGLTRTNSMPIVSTKLKRKKKRQKRETEMIVLSAPIGRQPNATDNLGDGIVGVNISSDTTRDSVETKRYPSPETEVKKERDADYTLLSSRNTINPQFVTIPSDKYDNSIYHLDDTRVEASPKSARTISLEGHGLPSLPLREPKASKVQPTSYSHLPNVKAPEVNTREDHSPDPQPQLSKQLYDFTSLCIGSDPSNGLKLQTIKQIQPTVRKAGVLPSSTSTLCYTPRSRPINASMSASKQIEDKTKNHVLSAPRTPENVVKHMEGSIDLSICASKIEDLDSVRGKSHSTQHSDYELKMTVKHSARIDDNGSNSSVENDNGLNMDYLMDSDSDVDITDFDPPKSPTSKKHRNASVIAKHQGTSSMNTNSDTLTKLQVIKDGDEGEKNTTVKILKSLDQDIYADFTHRKHRNSTFANSNDLNSSKVVLVKVRCSTKDVVTNNEDNGNDTDDTDSDLS